MKADDPMTAGPADLAEADLRGADLHGADLAEADLHGANLRWADLRGAGASAGTLWPDGFDPAREGVVVL